MWLFQFDPDAVAIARYNNTHTLSQASSSIAFEKMWYSDVDFYSITFLLYCDVGGGKSLGYFYLLSTVPTKSLGTPQKINCFIRISDEL